MTEDEALRLAEALVFASAGPVGARALSQLLPEDMDADAVLAAIRAIDIRSDETRDDACI